MAKLFFSRYSLFSGRSDQAKFEILLEGLRDDATVKLRGFTYRFLETTVFEYDGKEFIAGQIVKYDPDDLEEVVDETGRQLQYELLANKVVGKARFILDESSSILMFCEVPRAISQKMFIGIFRELFEQNHENFFTTFDIALIKERYSFIERAKAYRSVKRIHIELFPSNPHFDDRWRAIDERLRRNGIDKYRETQENKRPGGHIEVDAETESKFLMSEDGYGHSKISGIDENGFEKTISTDDREKNIHEVVPPESEKPADLLDLVYSVLRSIVGRTNE